MLSKTVQSPVVKTPSSVTRHSDQRPSEATQSTLDFPQVAVASTDANGKGIGTAETLSSGYGSVGTIHRNTKTTVSSAASRTESGKSVSTMPLEQAVKELLHVFTGEVAVDAYCQGLDEARSSLQDLSDSYQASKGALHDLNLWLDDKEGIVDFCGWLSQQREVGEEALEKRDSLKPQVKALYAVQNATTDELVSAVNYAVAEDSSRNQRGLLNASELSLKAFQAELKRDIVRPSGSYQNDEKVQEKLQAHRETLKQLQEQLQRSGTDLDEVGKKLILQQIDVLKEEIKGLNLLEQLQANRETLEQFQEQLKRLGDQLDEVDRKTISEQIDFLKEEIKGLNLLVMLHNGKKEKATATCVHQELQKPEAKQLVEQCLKTLEQYG